MTRIDPGPPIVVGERERDALAERFAAEEDVVAAYLFGSQARGQRVRSPTSTWRCGSTRPSIATGDGSGSST